MDPTQRSFSAFCYGPRIHGGILRIGWRDWGGVEGIVLWKGGDVGRRGGSSEMVAV